MNNTKPIDWRASEHAPYRGPSPEAIALAPEPVAQAIAVMDRVVATRIVAGVEARKARETVRDTSQHSLYESTAAILGGHEVEAANLRDLEDAADAAERYYEAARIAEYEARQQLRTVLASPDGEEWCASTGAAVVASTVELLDLCDRVEELLIPASLLRAVRSFVDGAQRPGLGKLMWNPSGEVEVPVRDGWGMTTGAIRTRNVIADLRRIARYIEESLSPSAEEPDDGEAPEVEAVEVASALEPVEPTPPRVREATVPSIIVE